MRIKANKMKKKIEASKELHMLSEIKFIGKMCCIAECQIITKEITEKISAINYFINNKGLDSFDRMDLVLLREQVNAVLFQSSIAFNIDSRIKDLKKMKRKAKDD